MLMKRKSSHVKKPQNIEVGLVLYIYYIGLD